MIFSGKIRETGIKPVLPKLSITCNSRFNIYQKGLFVCFFLIFFGFTAEGQQRSCGLNQLYQSYELETFVKKHALSGEFNNEFPLTQRSNRYIPLVFNIVLESGRPPITLKEIEDQIEVLNESFNAANTDLGRLPKEFRPYAANSGLQFCLAYIDDDTGLQPAIRQKTTDLENFGDLVNIEGKLLIKYSALGGFDAMDPQKYVNIWITELSAYQGFATLPGESSPGESGIVIDPDYFGYYPEMPEKQPFNLGKTLVHEMGHYFGLLHTWGLEESCTSDDGIEDTPLQGTIYYGCPSHPQISCGTVDMFMNYMNFTDDPCLIFFTEGQKKRMDQMINAYYPTLAQSGFCKPIIYGESPVDDIWINYKPSSASLRLLRQSPDQARVDYRLLDAAGRTVISGSIYGQREKDIYLNNIAAGVYILFLQDYKKFISRKLIFIGS